MRKHIVTLMTIAALSAFLPTAVFAQRGPSMPHKFYGTVRAIDGTAPADNLSVEAKIDGVVAGSSATNSGRYGYAPIVLFALDPSGVNAGKTVTFWVNGTEAGQTALFANGYSTNLNLIVPGSFAAQTTNPPSGGGGGTSGGSSGGGSSSGRSSSSTRKSGDATNDGRIDLFDFNTIMIQWSQSGQNLTGDLDKNGRVDLFDFNIIMINWGK